MQLNRTLFGVALAAVATAAALLFFQRDAGRDDNAPVANKAAPTTPPQTTEVAADSPRRDFPIQNRPAAQVAKSLQSICGARLESISVDPKANFVSVSGPESVLDEVARLIRALDEASLDPMRSTHVVTLSHADPRSVEEAIAKIFAVKSKTATHVR